MEDRTELLEELEEAIYQSPFSTYIRNDISDYIGIMFLHHITQHLLIKSDCPRIIFTYKTLCIGCTCFSTLGVFISL